MGFLTGHELTWMPEALRILRDELPNIDVMISNQYSPQLANALSKGTVDAAYLRRERAVPELAFRLLVKEPLMVVLPRDHRLAALKAISPYGYAAALPVICPPFLVTGRITPEPLRLGPHAAAILPKKQF